MIVTCTSCRARFNAPDEFAGRKVRCRKCQTIIAVPFARARAAGGNGKDVLYVDELESLDDADFGGGGRNGDHAGGGARLDLVDPDELFQQASAHFDAPRSNALYFYPLSGQVDRWLPFLLVLPAFVWLCKQAFTTASAAEMPGWVGPVRLFLTVAGFLVFVLPACYVAVRVAAKRLNFRMPPWTLWRVGAAFSLPYVLAAAMWLIAGETSDFFTGCIVGLLMALPALWLLLRLEPEEGPVTLALAGGAFAASTAAVVGLTLLFAGLANASADPANKPTAMRENPLGPGLRWDRPPDKPKTVVARNNTPAVVAAVPARQEAPVTSPTTNPVVATTSPWITSTLPSTAPSVGIAIVPQPRVLPATTRPVVSDDPLNQGSTPLPPGVASIREGMSGRFETLLTTPGARSYVAALTRSPEGQPVVTRYDTADWRPAGEAAFSGQAPNYHLSSDGALVARLTTFPTLSVQVYSFIERRFRDPVRLDDAQGEPSILGFAGPASLLIRWRRADDGTSALEVVDVMAGKWSKRIAKVGLVAPEPGHFTVSDDGRAIALLSREGHGADAAANVCVYGLATNDRLAQRIPVTQLAWNARVRVSGIALTPGRDEISLLLEHEGQAMLLAWDVETAKPTRQHILPAGVVPPGVGIHLFDGNALSYVDGGRAWLVYGSAIYDTAHAQRLTTLGLPTPIRQWVIGDTCYLYRHNDRTGGMVNAVRLDPEKLRGLPQP